MTRWHITSFRRQAGLTLVELMVALAIGSFLIIGAVQIYNQSRQAFIVNESVARVQETAQFAMDTIGQTCGWQATGGATAEGWRSRGALSPPIRIHLGCPCLSTAARTGP